MDLRHFKKLSNYCVFVIRHLSFFFIDIDIFPQLDEGKVLCTKNVPNSSEINTLSLMIFISCKNSNNLFLQKRCYYSLYLWLNLPESYRRDTFHTLQFHENFPTATLPVIHTLTNVLANELSQTESGLKLFASHVLKENTITVRNLILCPIPWPIMSNSLKLKYAQMWFWLKQSSSRRMVRHIVYFIVFSFLVKQEGLSISRK